MKVFLIFMCSLLFWNSAVAEGLWQSNGYVFSNVNVTQRGQEVTISGRVSSGQAQNPLRIEVEIENDDGQRKVAVATVKNYVGKGELFKAKVSHHKRSLWWNVKNLSVYNGSDNFKVYTKNESVTYSYYTTQFEPEKSHMGESTYKYFHSEKNIDKDKISVKFKSEENIQVVIRQRDNKNPVLIKNIEPHESRSVLIKPGEYNAKIISNGEIRSQDFIVLNDGEEIELK